MYLNFICHVCFFNSNAALFDNLISQSHQLNSRDTICSIFTSFFDRFKDLLRSSSLFGRPESINVCLLFTKLILSFLLNYSLFIFTKDLPRVRWLLSGGTSQFYNTL